jgi:hypothetical protein
MSDTPNARKKMRRGALSKTQSELVGGWFPKHIVDVIDRVVVARDTDRSKFLREAVREKLARDGHPLPTAA